MNREIKAIHDILLQPKQHKQTVNPFKRNVALEVYSSSYLDTESAENEGPKPFKAIISHTFGVSLELLDRAC